MPAEEMRDRVTPQTPAVATRAVLAFSLGFLAFVAIIMAILHVYLKVSALGPLIAPTHEFPQPRLQSAPQKDLARFDRKQSKLLSSYGWVDQSRGLIHIPIADAMRIVAGRGASVYDGVKTTPAAASDSGGNRP